MPLLVDFGRSSAHTFSPKISSKRLLNAGTETVARAGCGVVTGARTDAATGACLGD